MKLSLSNFYFLIGLCILSMQCKTTKKNLIPADFSIEAQAIEKVMADQEKAWNAGDIDTFMEGYWKSEKMTFAGKRGITYGWEKTLYNYKKGYPTKEIMGKLTFEIHNIFPLSQDAAYLLGKFNLEAKDGDSSGYFTLVWRKIDGEWKIVSDHTSG